MTRPRHLAAAIGLAAALCVGVVGAASADEYVSGYYRSSGTYVGGYYRSSPDSYLSNNYSSYGNVNPYTGSIGTHHYQSNDYYSSGYYSTSSYRRYR